LPTENVNIHFMRPRVRRMLILNAPNCVTNASNACDN
jgi:hypothetical protein